MAVEWLGSEPEVDVRQPDLPGGGWRTRVALALIAVLAAGGIGYGIGHATRAARPRPAVRTVEVAGTVVLHSGFSSVAAGNGVQVRCLTGEPVGPGRFDDIQAGTPVLVTDVNQLFVGATRLDAGALIDRTCQFVFTLAVPATSAIYEFQIGNRVGPAVPRSQLGRVVVDLG